MNTISQLRHILQDTVLYSSAAPLMSHTRYLAVRIVGFLFSHQAIQNTEAQNSVRAHQGLLQPEHKADYCQSCSACFLCVSINVYAHIPIYLFF
jgi:hypothetical protein